MELKAAVSNIGEAEFRDLTVNLDKLENFGIM